MLKFLRLCIALVTATLATSAFAISVNLVSGGLPRDYSQGYFDVVISVENLTDTDLQKGDPTKISDTLSLYLSELDDSTAISYDASQASTSAVKFYATLNVDPPTTEKIADNNTRVTYNLRIQEATGGEMKTQGEASKLGKLGVVFKLGGTQQGDKKTFTLEQENYVINAAPTFDSTAIVGTNRTLRVQWQVVDAVPTKTSSAAGSKKPSSMTVFLVDKDQVADGTSLPARTYSPTEKTDPVLAGGCQYRVPASETEQTTCVECPENVYLDAAGVKAVAGITVNESVAFSDGGVSFSGLENNKQYVAFMMYEPDGIQRSSCVIGMPTPNLSLTELNGEKEAKLTDFTCFIATAAYGSPLHKDLALFRRFRDEVLLKSVVGKGLVHLYYEYSPPLADFIAEHESLRAGTRNVLEKVAKLLRKMYGDPTTLAHAH